MSNINDTLSRLHNEAVKYASINYVSQSGDDYAFTIAKLSYIRASITRLYHNGIISGQEQHPDVKDWVVSVKIPLGL